MRKLLLLASVLMLMCPVLPAQQTLDNDGVIRLAKAGTSDSQIIATIKASPGKYDISMYALDVMRKAGISEYVLEAIVRKTSGVGPNIFPGTRPIAHKGTGAVGTVTPVRPAAPSPKSAPPADTGNGSAVAVAADRAAAPTDTKAPVSEALPEAPATGPNGLPVGINNVGVYYKDKTGAWVSMPPEIVNFQSTGKIRNIASAGILKGDLEGRIDGTRARVDATLPVVLAVYLPENVEITGYLLLGLHPSANARSFLSAEGGLLRTQPGAQRDEIDFLPEKLAPRLYQITIPATEGKGEFGLLAPGTRSMTNKETTRKIYTVSVAQ